MFVGVQVDALQRPSPASSPFRYTANLATQAYSTGTCSGIETGSFTQTPMHGAHRPSIAAPAMPTGVHNSFMAQNSHQGISLPNAEPVRGGQFDRQFAWSSQLLELNEWHFKNRSFRGCQEQVRLPTWPTSCTSGAHPTQKLTRAVRHVRHVGQAAVGEATEPVQPARR
jgi:hypothetical protein